jgi:hypothetical protein
LSICGDSRAASASVKNIARSKAAAETVPTTLRPPASGPAASLAVTALPSIAGAPLMTTSPARAGARPAVSR